MAAAECTVCLEEIIKSEASSTLPCDHVFHRKCLSPWLVKSTESSTCPTCRAQAGCVLCIKDKTTTEKKYRLKKCGHCFHKRCLQKLFSEDFINNNDHNNTCPFCRIKISKVDEFRFSIKKTYLDFSATLKTVEHEKSRRLRVMVIDEDSGRQLYNRQYTRTMATDAGQSVRQQNFQTQNNWGTLDELNIFLTSSAPETQIIQPSNTPSSPSTIEISDDDGPSGIYSSADDWSSSSSLPSTIPADIPSEDDIMNYALLD